jgi:hypothetical protein
MWAIARVPLSNPAALELPVHRGPEILCFSRRPTGVGPAVAGVAAGVMARAARAALWAALMKSRLHKNNTVDLYETMVQQWVKTLLISR